MMNTQLVRALVWYRDARNTGGPIVQYLAHVANAMPLLVRIIMFVLQFVTLGFAVEGYRRSRAALYSEEEHPPTGARFAFILLATCVSLAFCIGLFFANPKQAKFIRGSGAMMPVVIGLWTFGAMTLWALLSVIIFAKRGIQKRR